MRTRTIKPAFFKNEELAELDFAARLLFIGLWGLADREGRLEDRPKRIKIEVFPGDNVDIENLLDQLAESGFILRYMVDDKKYIQVINFAKHQRPHANEVASEIPATHLSATLVESTCDQGDKDFALDTRYLILDNNNNTRARDDVSNAFVTYEQNMGLISPHITERIGAAVEDTSDELVCEAIKRTMATAQRPTWAYAEGIIKDWHRRGIRTLAEVQALDIEHENAKAKPQARAPSKRGEGSGEQLIQAGETAGWEEFMR